MTSSSLPISVVELRTTVRRRLFKFRQLQTRYQPEVSSLLPQPSLSVSETDPGTDAIQNAPLLLPSSLPPEYLDRCSKRLVVIETELRIGQCRNSLSQLCANLAAKTRLLKYKYVNVRHQAPNTRSRDLVNQTSEKIDACTVKYRHAFKTLQTLDPSDNFKWQSEFHELRPQDVRGLAQPELPSAPTQERAEELLARSLLNGGGIPEGNQTVSWIWRGLLKDSDGQTEYSERPLLHSHRAFMVADAGAEFRIEWSKARARQARWSEEVALLKEEMRRVLESLKWKSNDWLRKGCPEAISALSTCPYQLEGLRAYASRQANVFGMLRKHFLGIWSGLEIPQEYLTERTHPIHLDSDLMELDGDDA